MTSITVTNHIDAAELSRWDPLRRRVLSAGRSAVLWGLVACLVLTALRAAGAWLDGHLVTDNAVLGFVSDPSVYSNILFGWIVFAYYLWLPDGVARVFNGLLDNDVFPRRENDGLPIAVHAGRPNPRIAELRDNVTRAFQSRTEPVVAVVVFTTVFVVLGFQYDKLAGTWYTSGGVGQIVAQLWGGALMTGIVLILLGCFRLIRQMRIAFREYQPNIRPAHPDGVGGLRPLGDFALRLVYLLSIVGIMLLAVTPFTRGLASGGKLAYTLTYELVAASMAYVIAAPTVFFLVLGTASRAMSDAKTRLLTIISDRSDQVYRQSLEAVEDSDDDEVQPSIARLMAVRDLYGITRDFPVWPFDGKSVRWFMGSYLSPLAVGLLIEVVLRMIEQAGLTGS